MSTETTGQFQNPRNFTPDLFPNESDRIVPHDEGVARLRRIREEIEKENDSTLENNR